MAPRTDGASFFFKLPLTRCFCTRYTTCRSGVLVLLLCTPSPTSSSHSYPPHATQVLDLGVTRMLVHRLVRVFPHVCKDHNPASGTTKGACRVANIRFEEMGRLSKASSVAPGCVLLHCLSLCGNADLAWSGCHVNVSRGGGD